MNFRARAALYFAPPVIRALLALATLPLMTQYLNVEDYGFFAFAMAIYNIFAVFPALGSSVILVQYFFSARSYRRKEIVSNMLYLSTFVGFVSAILCTFSWLALFNYFPEYGDEIPNGLIVCMAITVVMSGWHVLSTEIATLDNEAGDYAFLFISKDFLASLSSLIALYFFQFGAVSLLVGFVIAGLTGAGFSIYVLRHYLVLTLKLYWFRIIFREAKVAVTLFFEHGVQFLERSIITQSLGLSQLGIFSHSRLYENVVMSGASAITRTGWSGIIEEVRNENPIQSRSWYSTQGVSLFCLISGLFFATIGYDAIGILSNQKFNDAAYFAAIWIAFIAVKESGFIPRALLSIHGLTSAISIRMIIGQLVQLIILFILIDIWGVFAIFIAYFLSLASQKLILHWFVRKLNRFPFHDMSILIQLGITIIVTYISYIYMDNFEDRLVLFAVSIACSMVIFQKIVSELLKLLLGRN